MAVTKARKAEQVEKLSADLKGVHNMVVATFSKLTVNQDFELRKAVRSAGGKYSGCVRLNVLPAPGTLIASNSQIFQPLPANSAVRFYRVTRLDTDGPEVYRVSPLDGAIAVGQDAVLQAASAGLLDPAHGFSKLGILDDGCEPSVNADE